MGSKEQTRQDEVPFRPIVAFDFDGTLTDRDSFRAFLAWRAGPRGYLLGMASLLPAAMAYLVHRNRGRLKAQAVRVFLKGLPRRELESLAREFATGHARKLLRPDAVRAWRRWQSQGARLVIVTASPETLVAPFARGLGADLLIATQLDFDEADRVSGRLAGKNCRGAEKARRLREVFGEDVRLEAAYGDSGGDKAMLAMTGEPGFKVFQARS